MVMMTTTKCFLDVGDVHIQADFSLSREISAVVDLVAVSAAEVPVVDLADSVVAEVSAAVELLEVGKTKIQFTTSL